MLPNVSIFLALFDSTSQIHWIYQTAIVFSLCPMIRSKKKTKNKKQKKKEIDNIAGTLLQHKKTDSSPWNSLGRSHGKCMPTHPRRSIVNWQAPTLRTYPHTEYGVPRSESAEIMEHFRYAFWGSQILAKTRRFSCARARLSHKIANWFFPFQSTLVQSLGSLGTGH